MKTGPSLLINSSYDPSSSSAVSAFNYMQQPICMIASLPQPSDAMYLAYSPPPSGQVLEFEYLPAYQDDDEFCRSVTALPPPDVNDSLDSLTDLSTFAPIFDEYINSVDSTRAPQRASMEANAILASNTFYNSDSFMIDLPNPLPATPMSACSSALGIHGEIKEGIRWADPVNSTRNICSTMEIPSSTTTTTSLHLPHPHITATSARAAKYAYYRRKQHTIPCTFMLLQS